MKAVTTFFIGLFLTFCSQQPDQLAEVKATGELVVLTRNNPTTYYQGSDGPAGLEYDLAKRFAEHLGVRIRLVTGSNVGHVVDAIGRGDAHLAAAGIPITAERKRRVRFTQGYQQVHQQVLYRRGNTRPRALEDLAGRGLVVASGSHPSAVLEAAARQHPEIIWRESHGVDTGELIEAVWQQKVDVTVAPSNEVALVRGFYPELAVAFDIGEPVHLAWAFPPETDDSLYVAAVLFFNKLRKSGELEQLIERHYGHVQRFDYVGSRKLLAHMQDRLPKYITWLKDAGARNGLDWRLLGAIAYQESHWNPNAVSPTGVRGIMMLTTDTAKQVGVEDRVDPQQSILGGAKYFALVKEKIPARVPEPDRTWLALAAYNVGFGHLEDARVLTQRNGGDPDRWIDVMKHLPLLSQKRWYSKTRYGYARGIEPVRFVQNIRRYYDVLVRLADGGGPAQEPARVRPVL